jgi:non-ribosomal peptide synthetase component F
VPNAGRPIADVEPLIGFFVNTLALRVDVSGAPTFTELVGRVRERALAAFSHAEVPFERLVEALNPPRDLSRNPIVQVIFQLFESAQDPTATSMDPALELPTTTALFDLRVDLVPLDATRQAVLERGWLEAAVAGSRDPMAKHVERFTARGLRVDAARGTAGMVLHDPLAVGVAIDPTLVTWEPVRLDVGRDGETDRVAGAPNCRVARTVDRDRFVTTFLGRVFGATR